jgi:hypothetical protein
MIAYENKYQLGNRNNLSTQLTGLELQATAHLKAFPHQIC